MTTTCQQIYVRARQSSPANAAIISQPSEILARIEAEQQAIFASLAAETRDRFQTAVSITSSSGASARVFNLSTLTLPLERVLQVTLNDGREAHQVDVLDVEAELSPRYIVRGQTLIEVSNDWLVGSGAVTATLVYVYGPTTITANNDYTQAISLPDAFADLLVLPVQKYLAQQRQPAPGDEQIDAHLESRRSAFAAYLTNYGGIASTRFTIPSPATGNTKK